MLLVLFHKVTMYEVSGLTIHAKLHICHARLLWHQSKHLSCLERSSGRCVDFCSRTGILLIDVHKQAMQLTINASLIGSEIEECCQAPISYIIFLGNGDIATLQHCILCRSVGIACSIGIIVGSQGNSPVGSGIVRS